jgi:AraC family transcriptional regulator
MLQLTLDPALVEEVAEEIGADGAELLDTPRTRDPWAEQTLLSLEAELEAGGLPGGGLYAESLANALAVHLLREHSSLGWGARQKAAREPEGGLSVYALKQALDFIGDNLASDFSLTGIAAAANLSPHRFSRLFKLSTGLSPHQYVIRERVEKAKVLLSGTEMPVGEVALACGFSHQAHLTRHFGRCVGTSPKKFRG